MQNKEERISRFSIKIANGPADEIWISKLDIEYAFGELQLSKNAMDLCNLAVIRAIFYRILPFLKKLLRDSGYPNDIPGKN